MSSLSPLLNAQKATVRFRLWGPTRILDFAAKKVLLQAHHTVGISSNMRGPVMLPTRITRSPHVNKRARDQFEIRLHSRFVSVNSETEDLAKQFFSLVEKGLPPGVGMRAQITTLFDGSDLYDAPSSTVQFSLESNNTEEALPAQ
ncbi:30S ribosomal protein S10 [Planoprotostelium fungivorum]|uniref:30S ribosomal protein S10 n=1 Tax=Planoprotostelium fungivorum TaxID=1890364 RepID=A0A2P6NAD5_9EUKA|nr:30S ribosomal protein S10 [Planoprotostelium fungivorum]